LIEIRPIGPELSIGLAWNVIDHIDEDRYTLAENAQHSLPHRLQLFRGHFSSRNTLQLDDDAVDSLLRNLILVEDRHDEAEWGCEVLGMKAAAIGQKE
jgi:hypothetical protein